MVCLFFFLHINSSFSCRPVRYMQLSSGDNKEKKVKRDKSDAWAYPCRTPQGLRSNLTCRLVNGDSHMHQAEVHKRTRCTADERTTLRQTLRRPDGAAAQEFGGPYYQVRPPHATATHRASASSKKNAWIPWLSLRNGRPRAAAWSAACRRGAAARPVSSRCSAVHLGRSLYYVLHYRACTP